MFLTVIRYSKYDIFSVLSIILNFLEHVLSETESVSIIRYKGCPLTGPLKRCDLRSLANMNGNLLCLVMEMDPVSEMLCLKKLNMLISVQNDSHVYRLFPVSFNIFSAI
jgi:hypothetical protein